MQHQRYIETAREIIETATSNEDLYRRLKGLAMDFAGDFPGAANDDIGRKIWFDGEYSVFLDAGGMGARVSYLDGTFPPEANKKFFEFFDDLLASENERTTKPWAMGITFGIYTRNGGEWMPSDATLLTGVEGTRKYLEFF